MVPSNRDCGEGVLAGVERSVAGFTVSVGTGPGESGGLDEHVVAFCPARSALGQRLKMTGSLPGSFSRSVRIGPPGTRSTRCTWPGMAARADKERSRAAGWGQATGTGAGSSTKVTGAEMDDFMEAIGFLHMMADVDRQEEVERRGDSTDAGSGEEDWDDTEDESQ